MTTTKSTTVLIAGATGMLGNRIAVHLLEQPDVDVRLLLRHTTPPDPDRAAALRALQDQGATTVIGDVLDPATLEAATSGVEVVVSALQGGPDVIVDGQIALAHAAVEAGVRRFLPSDFAIDLFRAPDGAPQFATRRRADAAIDALDLEVVHVLTGAFMDAMLDPATPGLINVAESTAMIWGTGDEPFDLTTVDDTARFAARLATDPGDVAGIRYFSGARSSFNEIVALTESLSGQPITRNVFGSADDLRTMVEGAENPWAVVPQWYLYSMLTTPPFPTDDRSRYPDLRPTGLVDYLTDAHGRLAPVSTDRALPR